VIPAIDLKGGRCVRLRQGVMSEETVFSAHPEEIAIKWAEAGAERLHVVDLDGAVEGRPANSEVIGRIVEAVSMPVQLGGGIRDMRAVDGYLNAGVSQIILGTVGCKDPEFVRQACREFPSRVILGIDARKGRIAVEGWTEETDLEPVELAKRFEAAGLSAIIYTDISRDGMETGPNVEATGRLARAVNIPVIASGGIAGVTDVAKLLPLAADGVIGMITGRALYDGSLDLKEAIGVARKKMVL
jgi:phosphoribosylformimino-5-aminoimidazole carboxamide ribotide isomerase